MSTKELKTLPNDEVIESQKYTIFSFITPKNGLKESAFMFRGAFPTIEKAKEYAKHLQEVNGDFNIFIGEGFKWTYFNDDLDKCTDINYKEERLNEIMKEYDEQMKKKDKLEKERQKEMIDEMTKDNKVKKLENSEDPEAKFKISLKEKLEQINNEEIKKSENNIKEIDDTMNKLNEAMKKLQ